jgi:hypothetical protein
MAKYANQGGDSGVRSYTTTRGSITVAFRDGSHYRYTGESAGAGRVAYMRTLAARGQGLNSYINRKVNQGYDAKW